ncbi:MAG TPA: hypothetical protein VNN76_07770 [Bacteroidota bacterium]|nr:hypothetical protein [Bacteroidota bacterium]
MSLAKKILLSWAGILSLFALLALFFEHREFELHTVILIAVMALVGLISVATYVREEVPRNKAIFINFGVFFLFTLHSYLYPFWGKAIFSDSPFASVYFFQYGPNAASYFFMAFAILYVVIDTLFSKFRIYQKYLLTLVIVGGTFTYYYYPILSNPRYLYQTPDILDYKAVSSAIQDLERAGITKPSQEQIAESADLYAWNDGVQVGTLFIDKKIARVKEILPYLEGENYLVLIFKPLFTNVIYMNVLCIVFILLFFGYQYKNDPPQGAYIEKIIFSFLPYCSLEIVHFFGYIKSVEFAEYLQFHSIAVYLSLLNVLLLLVFFSLRLRFITSVTGNFYERELVSDPEHTSRWRDSIDSLIVRHFLNPKTLHGRFLAPRSAKTEA